MELFIVVFFKDTSVIIYSLSSFYNKLIETLIPALNAPWDSQHSIPVLIQVYRKSDFVLTWLERLDHI